LHLLLPGVAAVVGIGGRLVLHTLLHSLLIEGKIALIPLPGFTLGRFTGYFTATAGFALPAARLSTVFGTGAL
jgi:hypothetical protein